MVTGRVGAGKTTLLKVLLGLLPLQTGELRWNGAPVADPGRFMTPPQAAYTPQVPRLCSDTIAGNISLGAPVTDQALARAVHDSVLEPDLDTMVEGLDTRVGPRGVRLSGGQVQRLAAARMLVTGADLLVIDDLSSALDTNTERLLWDRLLSRVASTRPAVLVVSHRQRVLRRADRVVVLRRRTPRRRRQPGPPARRVGRDAPHLGCRRRRPARPGRVTGCDRPFPCIAGF